MTNILIITCTIFILIVAFIALKKSAKREIKAPEICVECKCWRHEFGNYGRCRLNGRSLMTKDSTKCFFKDEYCNTLNS